MIKRFNKQAQALLEIRRRRRLTRRLSPGLSLTGQALLLILAIMLGLSGIVAAYLFMNSQSLRENRIQKEANLTFNLAEGGLEKALWYLRYTAPDSSTDGSWRQILPGLTETLSGTTHTYTMVVDDWNLALSTNPPPFNSTATASSNPGTAGNAIDGNTTTDWSSSVGMPQWLQINFPVNSNFTINEARFIAFSSTDGMPQNYTWQVSTDGATWTTVCNVTSNTSTDRTDLFTALPVPYTANNVNYVRLYVTGAANNRVRIRELETHWIRLKAMSTLGTGVAAISKFLRRCILLDSSAGSGKTVVGVVNTWGEIDNGTFNNSSLF